MVMITRYQKKSSTYGVVFENPLLLSMISSFLNEKDIIHFSITNKKFHPTDSQLGCEVIKPVLDKYYEKYIEHKKEEQKQKTDKEFITKLKVLFQNQENRNNVRNTSRVFDHIIEYKDHIMSMKDTYAILLDVIESRLVRFVQTNEGGFAPEALHYLFAMFDISVRAHVAPSGEPDEYVEYIVNTKGEVIYI